MTEPIYEGRASSPGQSLAEVFRLWRAYGASTLLVASVVAAMTGVAGFVYLKFGQTVTRISYLEFRPTFDRADRGEYPNGIPFALSDVTAASVMNTVYDQVGAEAFCDRTEFRGAFTAEQYSDVSLFLDLEYRALLSQPRLELGERRELEQEYMAKRAALPMQYRLVFAQPEGCSGMPAELVVKSMEAVLKVWAVESDSRRGVLNHQVQVLSPSTVDILVDGPGGWVLGADLLRSALGRLVLNIEQVASLPGASLVRVGDQRRTFLEVRDKVQDLIVFKLEPLVLTSGQSLASQSLAWINETVESSEREARLAESRVAVYRDALREYSGESGRSDDGRLGGVRQSSASPAVTQTIDRSFVDRIVEMSLATAPYRQELTAAMVKANLEAVDARNRANYYRRLVQSLRTPNGIRLTSEELNARLNDIVTEGKALATLFGQLYEEFSSVSLRPAAAMYQTLKPVATIEAQAFTRRSLYQLVLVVFVATALVSLAWLFVRDRLRQVGAPVVG